jgi:hypothetical protein
MENLMERDFAGREALLEQLNSSHVRWIGPENAPAMLFRIPGCVQPAGVEYQTPLEAEGIALDEDGVPIRFVVRLEDGFLDELEVFREDGAPIRVLPNIASIRPAYP